MLNLFLRDAGDSTQEERDMVDEVEYKLLHPDLGDTVQGNKTSFGNNSNMVNFNLSDNTDYEKLFASLPEKVRRMMFKNLNARRKIDRYIADHPPVETFPRFYLVLLRQPIAPMESDGMSRVYQM